MIMNPEPDKQDELQKMLALKRHEAPSPRSASRDEWSGILRKMAPRAGLYDEDRDRVLRWLQANSR